eukprot:10944596-Ditylum_brightwellii.AAC.1
MASVVKKRYLGCLAGGKTQCRNSGNKTWSIFSFQCQGPVSSMFISHTSGHTSNKFTLDQLCCHWGLTIKMQTVQAK